MLVRVRSLAGAADTCSLPPGARVADLRAVLAARLGSKPRRFRLYCKVHEIERERERGERGWTARLF
jgi:hypothetical protein